jgi:H+-translocating NAD(P) transhydrogenase subunit alpha
MSIEQLTDQLQRLEVHQVIDSVYILVLAGFVGFEVIRSVSPLLHTPLMSATNAISGISLVGSLLAAGNSELGILSNVLGFIAVTAATINVVGGFMITDRMLKMFKLTGGER